MIVQNEQIPWHIEGEEAPTAPEVPLEQAPASVTRPSGIPERTRELEADNARLHELNRLKSEFLTNVSHDLQTPLASIKAAVTGLLDPEVGWDRATMREQLVLINEETDRLTLRVRNLLDIARLEAGVLPMERSPCDLACLLHSAAARIRRLAPGRPVAVDVGQDLLLVEGDGVHLDRVLLNLLDNALHYSFAETRIHMRAYRKHGLLGERAAAVVEVTNRGPGLSPDEIGRIFQRPYPQNWRSHAGGSGLGLAIVRSLVEAHGGGVGARSVPGEETTFWFALPLAEGCEESIP